MLKELKRRLKDLDNQIGKLSKERAKVRQEIGREWRKKRKEKNNVENKN